MGISNPNTREIQAKIVLYGAEGSGTSSNLRYIHRKLKREHRGGLRILRSPAGSGGAYECLPVDLGSIRGYRTSIHLYTVPGGASHAATRRDLLKDADGVIFVADLRPQRHAATIESLRELDGHLKHHRHSYEDVPLVLQYNHRDEVQENAVEALHRAVPLQPSAAFESVASEGTGVLVTLTTLSKLILNRMRREPDHGSQPAERAAEEPVVLAEPAAEVEIDLEVGQEGKRFRVESGGPVEGTDCDLRIPIVLVEEGSGRRVELSLTLSVEPRA
jgi:hypothetical protein